MRGQIIERGTEKYLLRVYIGRDAKGKRQYASKMFYGKQLAAQRALTAMLRESDTETLVRPTQKTFEQFVEEWYAWKLNVTESTVRLYKEAIKRWLLPAFGLIKVHAITPTYIQHTVAQWAKDEYSPRTIQFSVSLLHQILDKAVDLGILIRNPAEKVTVPEITPREFTILSVEQMLQLFKATQEDRHHALWVLLLTTGLRPGEALAMKWSDLKGNLLSVNRTIKEKLGTVVENQAKTDGSLRTLPLGQLTMNALKTHRSLQTKEMLAYGPHYERNDFIFATARGQHYSESGLRKAWKRVLKRLGFDTNTRLYDTRHSHATALLNEGVNLKAIADRLGHSNTHITESVYARIMPKAREEVVRVIDGMCHFAQK